MKRFIEGDNREQGTLLPEHLDDYVGADNPVRVVDVFVDELDLRSLGFDRVQPAKTGRPAYHPAVLLKLYIYGYLVDKARETVLRQDLAQTARRHRQALRRHRTLSRHSYQP